jgi:hypothetical protein
MVSADVSCGDAGFHVGSERYAEMSSQVVATWLYIE